MAITKVQRVALVVVLATAGLAALLLVGAHSGPARDYLIRTISEEARSSGVALEIGGLDYNLIRGTVDLRKVTASRAAPPGLPAFASADRVHVDVSVLNLVRGSLAIESASVDGLALHLVTDEQGRSNLPDSTGGQPRSAELPPFLIASLGAGGSFAYEDRRAGVAVSVPEWRVEVKGTPGTHDHRATLQTARPGVVTHRGRALAIDAIALAAGFNRRRADIEELRAQGGANQLVVKGTVDGFDDPALDLRIGAGIDLPAVLAFAAVAQPVRGRANAIVQIGNRASAPDAVADVTTDGLSIDPVGAIDLRASVRWDGAARSAEVTSAAISTADGRATATATWTGNANRASVSIERLDLESLSRRLRLPIQVAGVATGTVDATWAGADLERAAAQAELRVTPARTEPAKDTLPVSAEIVARGRDRRVSVEARAVGALGVDLRMNATVGLDGDRALAGAVHGRIDNAAATARALNTFLGRVDAPDAKAEGTAGFDITLDGTLARPSAALRVDGVGLGYGPIRDAGLHIEADYEASRATVRTARLAWAGASLTAHGTVVLTGENRALTFEAASRDIPVGQVLGALEQDVPVRGSVSFEARGSGTVESPDVSITLTGGGLEAYREPLGQLAANARFVNRELRVESLRLEKTGGGTLEASGTLATGSNEFAARVEASRFTLTNLPVRATVDLAATGRGNIQNPSAQWTLRADRVSAEGRDLGALEVTGKLADRQAAVNVSSPHFGLRAEATARTEAPYPANVTAQVANLDLSKLDASVKGSVSARIEASGDAQKWRDASARLEVSSMRVETPAGVVANEGAIRARYDGGTLAVEHAAFRGLNSSLALAGKLPGVLSCEGRFDFGALLEGRQEGVAAQGVAELKGEVSGDFSKLRPAAALSLRDGKVDAGWLNSPVEKIQLQASLEGGQLHVRQLEATLGAGQVTAQGTIPLGLFDLPPVIDLPRDSAPARFSLEAKNLSLDSVADLPEDVKGAVSMRLEASASRPELEAATATVTLDQVSFDLGGVHVAPDAPPVISLRNGVVEVDRFTLRAPGSELTLSGSASIAERELRNVRLAGNVDAALAGAFSQDLTAAGAMSVQVSANGNWIAPALDGHLAWSNGQVALASPAIQAGALDVRIAMRQHRVEIERFRGELNGGSLAVTGGLQLDGGDLLDARFDAKASDVYLEFPTGLRSLSDVDLRMRPERGQLVLAGNVRIKEGSYTEPLDTGSLLRQYLQSRGGVELVEERNPMLARLRFDIAVRSDEPIVVDNDLAEIAVATDVRLLGNYYRPALTGRIEIEEGGLLRLQENEYIVEQGTISFVNEARIEPLLNLSARTRVKDREITLRATSGQDGLETTLASDNPTDTQADIVALLLTGRTAEGLQGRELNVAGEQVGLSLLAGSVTGSVSRGLQNTLGLSKVRLEPNLISAESDPSARLTIGQDITSGLELIYSMNLTDSNDQIVVVDYDITRRFTTRGTKQADNTYRFDFQHDLRFGLRRPAAAQRGSRVELRAGNVEFTGELGLPRETLAKKFGIESGDRYDFFKARKGIDRIESLYVEQGYLESKVRLSRATRESMVDLQVRADAGPRVEFVFEGWEASGGLRKRVRDLWVRGVFDSQRAESGRVEIQRTLAEEGYLQAQVEHEIRARDSGRKQVLFTVTRGSRYSRPELVFDGTRGIEAKTLSAQIDRAELRDRIQSKPSDVRDFLARYYRQEGFLDATIDGPKYEFDHPARRARIRFEVTEGPKYTFGQVAFDGATVFDAPALEKLSGIRAGTEYKPELAIESRDRVEEAYWAKGYRDVAVDFGLVRDTAKSQVDVMVKIAENRKSVVREVTVEGTEHTSDSFVRRQIELRPGDALDHTKTALSRRHLYDSGAFSAVDLIPSPVAETAAGEAKQVNLLARVQERVPWVLRYGGFYDTDRGPGFIADFSNRNMLGGGRLVGVRTRYDGDVRELRGYFSQPLLRILPLRTDAAAFLRRELREAFITDRTGVSVQQETRLRNRFLLTYGYRFERAHTFDRDPDVFLPFDEVLRVAPLTATLSRDTRDEILDATRGSFTSHGFEYASGKLGSSLLFARYFGQYFKYIGLTSPEPVPLGGGLERSRVVYASGVRVGLAKGLGGQDLIRSERFFAGGGTTIRGFEQDTLGPVDFLDRPAGGEGVLMINNEIRFPVVKLWERAAYLDGVAFLDVGNVYAKLGDFSLRDIRKTGGPGLRIRTPYFLIRFDYGFKLDRRIGESRGEFFFSIGQAF